MASEQCAALAAFVAVLEDLGIPYFVGGSVASSVHGVPRMTQDVDVVAALEAEHVEAFVASVRDAFYVDGHAIHEAIARGECFNVIHLETVAKIDVFISDRSEWSQCGWGRRVLARVSDAPNSAEVYVASAEDAILHKLRWYRLGGGVSERQWCDVLGIIQVRGGELDRRYLDEWADRLGLKALLDRALVEAEQA